MARHEKKTFIYGRHPVNEILRSRPRDVLRLFIADPGSRLSALLRTAEHHEIQIVQVPKRKLGDMVGDVPHQGIVAMVAPFAYTDIAAMLELAGRRDEAPLILALDQIQDPHNLGSMVRSALACGAHGLIFPKDRACEINPTVVKASAGATAHLNIAKITNVRRALEELKGAGLWVYGAVAEGGLEPWRLDLTQPSVLVIGSEGKGLRPLVLKTCDQLLQIPLQARLGSLNASVAGAVCLYEALRQRAFA